MLKEIVFKDHVINGWFIDSNSGRIFDSNGNEYPVVKKCKRFYFKGAYVHQLMMWTFKGYQEGMWVHHIDENPLNNNINNLEYKTPQEHNYIHKKGNTYFKGRKHSEESKQKNREAHLGKTRTEELKHLQSDKMTGMHFWNNGLICIRSKECPIGFVKGMLKNK